jgi:hypothetical protein
METRIEITGMKVSEVNKLGDHIKGNWHIEAIADKNDKTKDKVWLVADQPQHYIKTEDGVVYFNHIRIEDVKEVI